MKEKTVEKSDDGFGDRPKITVEYQGQKVDFYGTCLCIVNDNIADRINYIWVGDLSLEIVNEMKEHFDEAVALIMKKVSSGDDSSEWTGIDLLKPGDIQ